VTEGSPSGFFIAGPFILKKLRNTNLRKFVRMNGLDETETEKIVNFAKDMPVMTPDEVSHLSLLFYNSIISALGVPGDYKGPRKLYEEQVLNSARIRKTKKEQKDLSFPYDLEKQLTDSILMGNAAGSEELMLAIMDRLSVVCLGDLNEIKTMALWVTATIIKSLSDETRMQFGEFMDVDLDIINRINNSDSQKELTDTFRSILDHLAKNMVSSVYSGSSALITQGLRIINRSYTEKITLSDISKSLHVNPTYFSSLFTREMGKTFSEYLMELRISKAEELLKNTGLSILDAATASGFDDQSYFTKVFRKHTGLTPGKYREQHS
jgi:YesN/AraC family two-component response regulator